ncbi:MAG TPA: hypothetical protein VM934_04530 [Pyrinomonadaceae bacterium]|jgi:lysophospholipase L1-like esterase|nr:hypothetical protein [Pyrinomonadaceae bacterium]
MNADTVHADAGYDLRSLQHERRMLATYRRAVSQGDAALLQPLANACWRAGAFEWALYGDPATARRLWGEAARSLAEGFARRRAGFDPSPDQFVLALHFAIAARERDAFTALAMSAPNLRDGVLREARAYRASRAHFHLAEGYALVARALAERQENAARAAVQSLDAAREESDRGWWEQQFPEPLDAAWRASEHEAMCLLLAAVARRVISGPDTDAEESTGQTAGEFARTVDETLRRLEQFVRHDANHHPKLYVWLPGLALCALASSAALPMNWIAERHASSADGYARMPLELLLNPSA